MLIIGSNQRGWTLIELMIAMTLGLIVIGAVLAVYLMTLKTSGQTINSGRLNQEAAAIMNIMVNDIRRAGYADATAADWNGNTINNFREPHTNPFNQRGSTALEVRDVATNASQNPTGSGDCIVYAYDANQNSVLDDAESVGFRLNGTSVEMRSGIDPANGGQTNSCASAGATWRTMNDDTTISIDTLTFDLGQSSCVITLEPDKVDNDGANDTDDLRERDCYAHDIDTTGSTYRATYPTDSPVPVVEVRNVLITLKASLIDDPLVKTKLQQRVTVRNHLARLVPVVP